MLSVGWITLQPVSFADNAVALELEGSNGPWAECCAFACESRRHKHGCVLLLFEKLMICVLFAAAGQALAAQFDGEDHDRADITPTSTNSSSPSPSPSINANHSTVSTGLLHRSAQTHGGLK